MSFDRFWILIARKLSGEASVVELRELEALLRANPDLHFSAEIITNLWNQHPQNDSKKLELSYQRHLERIGTMGVVLHPESGKEESDSTYLLHGSRKTRLVRKLAVAASVLLLIFAGSYYYLGSTKSTKPAEPLASLEVNTKNGSRTKIQLPDGSKVWLNSGSTLTYDKQFGKDIREVILSGEAFFDVVRNVDKPFIIHTTAMDIKVLGTKFNVKSYAEDKVSEASLIHGSIEVSLKNSDADKFLLKPNQKIVIMNDRVVKDSAVKLSKPVVSAPLFAVQKLNYSEKDSTFIETSWVDNKLIFENESFEDIALKMERWFDVLVEFADVNLKNERLTGSFKNETIEDALDALQMTTAFRYFKKNNRITITK